MISSDVHEKALCQIHFQIVTLKPMTTQDNDNKKFQNKARSNGSIPFYIRYALQT